MTTVSHLPVVISLEMYLAVATDSVMLLSIQDRDAVAFHGGLALMTDVQPAVVLDLLFHITLGAQVDQFMALAILDMQFVETTPPGVLRLRKTLRVLLAGNS